MCSCIRVNLHQILCALQIDKECENIIVFIRRCNLCDVPILFLGRYFSEQHRIFLQKFAHLNVNRHCKLSNDDLTHSLTSMFGIRKVARLPISRSFCRQFNVSGVLIWTSLQWFFIGLYLIDHKARASSWCPAWQCNSGHGTWCCCYRVLRSPSYSSTYYIGVETRDQLVGLAKADQQKQRS